MIIPYNFEPRPYQLNFLRALDEGKKRAVWIVHRRGGKDKTGLNYCIKEACRKVGTYFYLFPTYKQGRKVIWDGIDSNGFRFIDHFPKEIVDVKNETEMKIKLKNGSIFQIIGTDEIDRIVGTNPIGCVFSEYALQNPEAWDLLRPILRENGGWAIFLYTPRGKNHGCDLYEMAKNNPDWFCERLTINETGVFTEKQIQQERKEGMPQELIDQEYYCSFNVGNIGSYYTTYIQEAIKEQRMCRLPLEKNVDVNVFFDLGRNDSTAMIFVQQKGKEIRLIDSYEYAGEGVDHYVKILKERNYNYGFLFLPHDGFAKRLEANKSIAEQFESAGFRIMRVPNAEIQNGIAEVRRIFPRLWFDEEKCKGLIRALENYRKEWDSEKRVFRDNPLHDWSSHMADAMRYLAIGLHEKNPLEAKEYEQSVSQFINPQDEYKKGLGIPSDQWYSEQKKSQLDEEWEYHRAAHGLY